VKKVLLTAQWVTPEIEIGRRTTPLGAILAEVRQTTCAPLDPDSVDEFGYDY
jgi:hypothetical protein